MVCVIKISTNKSKICLLLNNLTLFFLHVEQQPDRLTPARNPSQNRIKNNFPFKLAQRKKTKITRKKTQPLREPTRTLAGYNKIQKKKNNSQSLHSSTNTERHLSITKTRVAMKILGGKCRTIWQLSFAARAITSSLDGRVKTECFRLIPVLGGCRSPTPRPPYRLAK